MCWILAVPRCRPKKNSPICIILSHIYSRDTRDSRPHQDAARREISTHTNYIIRCERVFGDTHTHTHPHFAAHIWINYARPFRRKFKMRARIRKLFAPSLCDNFQIVIERSPGGGESLEFPCNGSDHKKIFPKAGELTNGNGYPRHSTQSAVFSKPINSLGN